MNIQSEMQNGGIDDQGRCEVDGSITETEEASSSFTGTYRKSIALVFSLLEDLIGRYVWAGHPIKTHPDASDLEMAYVLGILKTLSPLVGDKLQIDTSSINKHSGIQMVLNDHTRGSAYMRQYFKLPLDHVTFPCDCIACSKGLFSPLAMPLNAYKEISGIPLPIPKPPPTTGPLGDLRYMTLEEAMQRPFTAEHRPSLGLRRARRSQNTTAHDGVALAGRERSTVDATNANKKFMGQHVRGVVECKDCMKLRCAFSL